MSGRFEITHVDWAWFRLDGGSMFGIVPKPIWMKLIEPDESNRIRLAARSLLVRTEARVLLVDCGMWDYFSEKLRTKVYAIEQQEPVQALKAATGLAPEDVTDIIATHLHFDHIGGLVARGEEEGGFARSYPNATLHVQRSQLDWALTTSTRDRASFVPELVDAASRLYSVALHDGPWQLEPGIHIDVAHGHTPGMQLVRIHDGALTLIHTADMIPTSSHVPVPYVMAYDNEPLLTAGEKLHYFTTYPEAMYFFEHDPGEPIWTIGRNEKGGWERRKPINQRVLPF